MKNEINEIIETKIKTEYKIEEEIKPQKIIPQLNPKINYFKCNKCKNYISLSINPHNFSVSYECDSGIKTEDIYFSTLNQFLSNTSSLEDLPNICSTCISSSMHDSIDNKKGLEYFAYCKACKIHLCPFCVGNHLKIPKKKHEIIFLGNMTPSDEDILEVKKNMNERIKLNNELIEKIENVKNKICSITNKLRNIILEETKLINNYINNFNPKFLNYHYLNNFYIINDYIKKIKNENLDKFEKEKDFKSQINILIDLVDEVNISKKDLEEIQKMKNIKLIGDYQKIIENPFGELKYTNFTYIEFCKRDNNFILAYDNNLKFYHILKNKNIYLNYEYSFKNHIATFLLSKNEEELYVSENGAIHILYYDKKEEKFIKPKGNKEESKYILYNTGKKFNKLFLLNDSNLITLSDDGKLGFWKRNDENIVNQVKKNNEKLFTNIKTITNLWSAYEFIQPCDYYFIALMRDCSIKFYDCNEINEIKTIKIKHGDYLREKFNHVVKLNNEYILIGVKNLYVLLSIKHMEIVTYYILPFMKSIISLYKYDLDNLVLFIGKSNDDDNIFVQFIFDEEDMVLKMLSSFENKIEKYSDCRYNFINNMIISYYYYYSSSQTKKFELFA